MAKVKNASDRRILSLIASEWSKRLAREGEGAATVAATTESSGRTAGNATGDVSAVEQALRRTIPLLSTDEPSTVPFLCRYRADVIAPLGPSQLHTVRDWVDRHSALSSLRDRAVSALDEHYHQQKSSRDDEYDEKRRRMLVSTSKAELDELYGPFKPPTKGSIAARIAESRPDIVDSVDRFWTGELVNNNDDEGGNGELRAFLNLLKAYKKISRTKKGDDIDMSERECVIYLLGSKIASSPKISDVVAKLAQRNCVVSTKRAAASSGRKDDGKGGAGGNGRSKYERYYDFKCGAARLKDHQVLAIRRGVNAKELKMTIAVPDDDYVKRQIRNALLKKMLSKPTLERSKDMNGKLMNRLIWDAVSDSWSRLLKRRSSQAVWREKVAQAEQRGITVFSDNVRSALMVPPQERPTHVLALDPGFQAGVKVALLDPRGEVLDHPGAMSTVHFVGKKQEAAIEELASLLKVVRDDMRRAISSSSSSTAGSTRVKESVTVALGNGHGSDESRSLIDAASAKSGVPIVVSVINEAGASVWSVTESAAAEFPRKSPASISAISIGRRLQDPMNELVKVPPRSLGLGMYQHDLPEKELDGKLTDATVDQVALVGVDVNSCSLELLRNVPGLTRGKLAESVVKARPFSSREDLKKVKGLGPKAFENCAGFIRIRREDGSDVLDSTRCHPESYPVARWIMKRLGCTLEDLASKLPSKDNEEKEWEDLLGQAARCHDITSARVENIITLLTDSADPRLTNVAALDADATKTKEMLATLPRNLSTDLSVLKNACPVRNIIGTVRNIADFGAFIDFGAENDGLLHNSKMGRNGRSQLAVGRQIGIDILGVCVETGRVSLGKSGHGYDSEPELGSLKNKRKANNIASAPKMKRQRR